MRVILLFTLISMIWACGNPSTDSTTPAQGTPAPPVQTAQKNQKKIASSNPNAIPVVDPNAESPAINIKVNGASPGLVRIIGFYQGEQYRADSVMTDASGVANFKGNDPWRTGLFYVSYPNSITFQMLVTADQTFSLETNANDVVGSMKVTGSDENTLLYNTLKYEAGMRTKFDQNGAALKQAQPGTPQHNQLTEEKNKLLAERKNFLNNLFTQNKNSFFAKYKEAGQNPTVKDIKLADGTPDKDAQIWHYRRDFWDNVDFNDLRLMNTPVVSNKLRKYVNDLTAQRPDSIIASAKYLCDRVLDYPEYFQYFANWITLNYDPLETSLMDPQAVYTYMIENYFTNERAFWSDSVEVFSLQQRAYEMSASLVGKKGPEVNAPSVDGSLKSLYAINSPYIIIYMYNPECEHCAVETPQLVQFEKQWKSQGVAVYAIAVDTEDAKWKDYINKNGMQGFTNVFDPTNKAIYGKYYVDHTPELYLLNPQRTIIGKNLKVNQVAEVINRDKNR